MEPVYTYYGTDDETVAEIDDGNIKVEWANIGEGYNGDYNPNDPDDVELLRFYVYEWDDGYWEPVDDASYCTTVPLHSDPDIIEETIRVLYKRFADVIYNRSGSVKKLGEMMSWISPDNIGDFDQ